MKTTIFYLSSDTDSGMNTEHFTTKEGLASAILASVESYDEETATAMRAIPFNAPEWHDLWCSHVEAQEERNNYFHYGESTIDIQAPTWRGSYVMQVPFISSSHITASDGAKLRENDPRDVLAPIVDGAGHIIYFGGDDIEDSFSNEEGFSQSFRSLLLALAKDGFEYVRLDCDGEIIPDLPTFDW